MMVRKDHFPGSVAYPRCKTCGKRQPPAQKDHICRVCWDKARKWICDCCGEVTREVYHSRWCEPCYTGCPAGASAEFGNCNRGVSDEDFEHYRMAILTELGML